MLLTSKFLLFRVALSRSSSFFGKLIVYCENKLLQGVVPASFSNGLAAVNEHILAFRPFGNFEVQRQPKEIEYLVMSSVGMYPWPR